MGAQFGYRKPSDLPAMIPVFPLNGAVLFPRGQLPLNIFEPRYCPKHSVLCDDWAVRFET